MKTTINNMKMGNPYFNLIIILLLGFISGINAQCDNSNEFQCNNDENCEWVEDIIWQACEEVLDYNTCLEYTECNSGCTGWVWVYGAYSYCMDGDWACTGSYQIENNYCQEVEVEDCSDLDQYQCNSQGECEWIEDLSFQSCSDLDSDENSCIAAPGCWWDCIPCPYYPAFCCGGSCEGGTFEQNESYCQEIEYMVGDVNGDEIINVLDIIQSVSWILDGEYDIVADMNGDGALNVLDIIEIVNLILGNQGEGATWGKLLNDGHTVLLESDGVIGGVQMTLNHSGSFNIQLADNALVSEYKSTSHQTTLVIVAPTTDELFTYTGEFEVKEMLIANSKGEIPVLPITHELKIAAYPNPFNPVTEIHFEIFGNGFTEVMIYDINGQLVEALMKAEINQGKYQIQWDASEFPSGMYLVRVESGGISEFTKLLLIK